jgi:hypothetical protein
LKIDLNGTGLRFEKIALRAAVVFSSAWKTKSGRSVQTKFLYFESETKNCS